MYAYVTEGSGKPERKRLAGIWFWYCPMDSKGLFARRRRARRWRHLRALGICSAVLPQSMVAEAAGFGIYPIAVAPLRRALLGKLAALYGGQSVLLCAPCVNREVEQAALTLARRYRRMTLDVGGDQALAVLLYRRFGLCVGRDKSADVRVSFGGAPTQQQEICLGEDCAAYQAVDYAIRGSDLPCDTEELLSVLFAAGQLKKDELCVKSLRRNA